MEHVDLEEEDDSRVSPPTFITPPQSPGLKTPEIDPV